MEDFKVPTIPVNTKCKEKTEAAQETEEEQTNAVNNLPIKPAAGTNSATSCPYKVPSWDGKPPVNFNYSFEVLKSGQIIDTVKDLGKKSYWTFGRLPENDIEMAHPTISRFHAVMQYRPQSVKDLSDAEEKRDDTDMQPPEGWYIYDLESTHGTFLNKQRVPPRVFIRVRVGHMIRLGASTRSYILQGPSEDEEPESELTVTELREQHRQQKEEAIAAHLSALRTQIEEEERVRNEGISWGMTDDADEETDLTHNPFASTNNEELFLDDPKKTLRGYFEREDTPLEYKCDEMSPGTFVCRVELPIDDANGRPLVAEVVHKGKKKECVVQCALEACRILDRYGVLRQSNQEPMKRKVKKDSDSDDDDFLDRTGDIERKKLKRMNTGPVAALTYEDLIKQEADLKQQMQQVEADILQYQEQQRRLKETKLQQEENDDLDSFMQNLGEDVPQLDKLEIRKLRLEQQRLSAEQQKVQRLIKITKPVDLLFASGAKDDQKQTGTAEVSKRQLPIIGKRNQFSKFKVAKTATISKPVSCKMFGSDEEEVEEDEEVQAPSSQTNSVTINQTENNSDNSPTNKYYGPAVIPQEILLQNKNAEMDVQTTVTDRNEETAELQTTEEHDESMEKEKESSKSSEQVEVDAEVETSEKKRRHRQRQRHKRHEVDIEELAEHEKVEKYAKWVPPENQTGDGFTELNKKFGY